MDSLRDDLEKLLEKYKDGLAQNPSLNVDVTLRDRELAARDCSPESVADLCDRAAAMQEKIASDPYHAVGGRGNNPNSEPLKYAYLRNAARLHDAALRLRSAPPQHVSPERLRGKMRHWLMSFGWRRDVQGEAAIEKRIESMAQEIEDLYRSAPPLAGWDREKARVLIRNTLYTTRRLSFDEVIENLLDSLAAMLGHEESK